MQASHIYDQKLNIATRVNNIVRTPRSALALACGLLFSTSLQAAQLVKDINSGSVGSSPNEITTYQNKLYFAADDGVNGMELWASDGTDTGSNLLKDINPGIGGSYPHGFKAFNDLLYFIADDGVNGEELWVTDGSSGGTTLVTDINSGSGDSSPSGLTASNGKLYFQANDGMTGSELWALDPASTCHFPLDETSQNVILSGANGKLSPSNGDQTGTYTVQSQLNSTENWIMVPAGVLQATNQVLDVSNGIVGVAFNPDQILESDFGNTVSSLAFFDGANVEIEIRIGHSDGVYDTAGYHVYALTNNGSSYNVLVNGTTTKPDQIGVYFNNKSGDPDQGYWGVSIDGTDYGYQYAFTGISSFVPALMVREIGGLTKQSAGRQGDIFISSFVTTAAGITAFMPTDATDACGNPL